MIHAQIDRTVTAATQLPLTCGPACAHVQYMGFPTRPRPYPAFPHALLRCLLGRRWTALPTFTPSRSRQSPSHTRRPLPRCACRMRMHGVPAWLMGWHAACRAGMCACTVWCAGTVCLHGWCAGLVCCTVGVCWYVSPAWAFCCLLLSVVTATCCAPGRLPAYLYPTRLPARLLAPAWLPTPACLPACLHLPAHLPTCLSPACCALSGQRDHQHRRSAVRQGEKGPLSS